MFLNLQNAIHSQRMHAEVIFSNVYSVTWYTQS